jgi:hypothetical protein
MLLLKSRHQAIIMAAADPLPPEKRQAFFDRAVGELQQRRFCSTAGLADSDITDAIERALRGLQYSASTFP